MSFHLLLLQDPEIDFKVESHFEGRVVPQLGSLIVNQVRLCTDSNEGATKLHALVFWQGTQIKGIMVLPMIEIIIIIKCI